MFARVFTFFYLHLCEPRRQQLFVVLAARALYISGLAADASHSGHSFIIIDQLGHERIELSRARQRVRAFSCS